MALWIHNTWNPGALSSWYTTTDSSHHILLITCNILLISYKLVLDESCWRIRSCSKNIYCSRKHNKFSSTGITKFLFFYLWYNLAILITIFHVFLIFECLILINNISSSAYHTKTSFICISRILVEFF